MSSSFLSYIHDVLNVKSADSNSSLNQSNEIGNMQQEDCLEDSINCVEEENEHDVCDSLSDCSYDSYASYESDGCHCGFKDCYGDCGLLTCGCIDKCGCDSADYY